MARGDPAQKPLLHPNPIAFPHPTDSNPSVTPTPIPSTSPHSQVPAPPSFLDGALDALPSYPYWIFWLLGAISALLVLHKALSYLKSYVRASSARRDLKKSLAERMEKYIIYGEDHGEGED